MMEKSARIYVAGHRGMVGSAIVRKLKAEGLNNIITKTSSELDLRSQKDVNKFFATEKPAFVFLAAAKVGGILANNTLRAEFLYDNLMIESNVIHQSFVHNVTKLLFLGSSCIYPKLAPQPMKEDALLSGYLETTNEPYAIAKIAGIKLCESYRLQYGSNFISAMPTNLYGPNDNYDAQTSHVLPALIRKFSEGRAEGKPTVELWGSGTPLREFLHVDDLANACMYLMQHYDELQFVNVGCGNEVTIAEVAALIKKLCAYQGEIIWDNSKPDGTPRKLMDSSKIFSLGWRPEIGLEEGLRRVIDEYQQLSAASK
jgi:GDP-L-fucose synthase